MSVKWKKTKHPGVRFYEHPTRKHGIQKDKYFSIRYQKNGKRIEEGLGWASKGWDADKASIELAALRKAAITGEGPTRLRDKRKLVEEKKKDEEMEREQREREGITFADIFNNRYYPQAKHDKDPQSYKREKSLFENWIDSVIGKLPLKDIAPTHIEKIKQNMKKSDLSPRSIQYCLAVVRQVFNFSYRHGIFSGDNPVTKVKIPKVDNRRMRFLTRTEADKLLNKLRVEAPETWEMAIISLHCGLRASEIFHLTWGDIKTDLSMIQVKDTKNTLSRVAHMTEHIRKMFLNKQKGQPTELVFPGPNDGIRSEISRAFERVVKELKLNEGIEDRRDKVCFHTLRHTYASWLVQEGESIYVVKDRLGHSTLAMSERYSHLAPENSQGTVKVIERIVNRLTEPEDEKIVKLETG